MIAGNHALHSSLYTAAASIPSCVHAFPHVASLSALTFCNAVVEEMKGLILSLSSTRLRGGLRNAFAWGNGFKDLLHIRLE